MIPHSRPSIEADDVAAVLRQLETGMLAEGARTKALEAAFRTRESAAGAVAVGSGCQALLLALQVLEITVGDEVILPSYVCPEVLGVVEWCGATPVIVDVADDYLLDATAAAAAITARTRAILLPYVLGLYRSPASLQALGLPLIEDCAPLLPASSTAFPLHGRLVTYSFEATKWVAGGEGGLVLTRDDALAARLVAAKRCRETEYKLNLFPLSDLQAALVLSQWARLPAMTTRRQALAARYRAYFAGHPRMVIVGSDHGVASSDYRLVCQLKKESGITVDDLVERCAARGVAVRRPVATLLHTLRPARSCPVAERLYACTFSLPLYPALTDTQHALVCATLAEALG